MFSRYYQDELAFLREMGREFAQAYPQLAPMLADRGGDPDVERLLEGTAFLTGRIRQKLDDELPEAIHAMSMLLFPQLVRPVPSATILEITPMANALRERYVVPQGTEFASVPVDGQQCIFSATAATEVCPWTIEDVRLELLPGGGQQLRVEMRVPLGLPIASFAPDKLRFYLTGEARSALTLLHMLHERTESIVLMESLSTGVKEREIPLGRRALSWAGFGDDEALLPFPRAAFPGFRLLAEYYALPQKFCFLDVQGVGRIAELDPAIDRFAVAFRFDGQLPPGTRIAKDALKLHCVPVVNIFSTTADPIRLSAHREEYLVRPAGLAPAHGEVYAVTRVQGLSRGSSKRFDVGSFYDFSHLGASRQDQFFYSLHLRPSVVGEGADLMMSFSTPEDAGIPPEVDVISVDMLATNRQHATAVRAGEIKEPTASSPAICSFKNLVAVTPHVPPPLGRELQWRVVAHATMNLRSLTEPEVLRAALDVYNLHGLVDRQAARANELRLAALKDIRLSAAERVWRGTAVRGVGIDVDLDEKGFDGDGDLFLFGAILDRFFANYVSLNSFSRTTVHGVQSKLKFAWPPRSGNLTLL